MKPYLPAFVLPLLMLSVASVAQTTWPEELTIIPEKSQFIRTSTHAEVMEFLTSIKTKSEWVQLTSMGKSIDGKEIPVAILAKPIIKTPEDARASGKPVIYIQGNIHAGEVEGKEAIMMLMRDILLGSKSQLLDNQIILFAPIYNTDSNDKMEKGRRPSQEDSPVEVGIRENSQGLDLNRDGMKMEATETQSLFTTIITTWDPQLFVDLHTTNGTWHAYSLTWAPSYHYAGEYAPYDFTNNTMLPSITQTLKEKNGLFAGPYGDYELSEGWPIKNFYTYNHHPRYLVNQFSLRNRMAILSEAFAHERFYQRINATYAFVDEILEYTNKHGQEMITINKKADAATIKNVIDNAGKSKKGVRYKMVPLQPLNNFRTYDYINSKKQDGSSQWLRTGNIVTYNDVTYHARFEPVLESTLPRGYIIPAELAFIADNLMKHGINVEKLTRRTSFTGETFLIEKLELAQQKFEGHYMATAHGTFSPDKKRFNEGDYIVDLAQPLGNLAFYLLEPQSDDGLVRWNFFDDYLTKHNAAKKAVAYPVFKYFK